MEQDTAEVIRRGDKYWDSKQDINNSEQDINSSEGDKSDDTSETNSEEQ